MRDSLGPESSALPSRAGQKLRLESCTASPWRDARRAVSYGGVPVKLCRIRPPPPAPMGTRNYSTPGELQRQKAAAASGQRGGGGWEPGQGGGGGPAGCCFPYKARAGPAGELQFSRGCSIGCSLPATLAPARADVHRWSSSEGGKSVTWGRGGGKAGRQAARRLAFQRRGPAGSWRRRDPARRGGAPARRGAASGAPPLRLCAASQTPVPLWPKPRCFGTGAKLWASSVAGGQPQLPFPSRRLGSRNGDPGAVRGADHRRGTRAR